MGWFFATPQSGPLLPHLKFKSGRSTPVPSCSSAFSVLPTARGVLRPWLLTGPFAWLFSFSQMSFFFSERTVDGCASPGLRDMVFYRFFFPKVLFSPTLEQRKLCCPPCSDPFAFPTAVAFGNVRSCRSLQSSPRSGQGMGSTKERPGFSMPPLTLPGVLSVRFELFVVLRCMCCTFCFRLGRRSGTTVVDLSCPICLFLSTWCVW